MHVEDAYLFRHALLRDAAYQLQPPTHKAQLHRLAADLIEQLTHDDKLASNSREIADHLMFARLASAKTSISPKERQFTKLAAAHERSQFALSSALALWLRLLDITLGQDRFEPMREAGVLALACRDSQEAVMLLLGALEIARSDFGPEEQAQVLTDIIDAHRSDGNVEEALKYSVEASQLVEHGCTSNTRARLNNVTALLLQQTGQIERAEALYKRAWAVCQQADIPDLMVSLLGNLAILYAERGDPETSREYYRQAIEMASTTHNLPQEGIWLGNLGLNLKESGKPEQAEAAFRKAIDLRRKTGDRRGVAYPLGGLALLLHETGRYEEAEALYEESLYCHQEVGNQRSAAVAMANLAGLLAETGRPQAAYEYLQDALKLTRKSANRRAEGYILCSIGTLHTERGSYGSAEHCFMDGLQILHELNDVRGESTNRCGFAVYLLAVGKAEKARHEWEAGAAGLVNLGDDMELQRNYEKLRKACESAGVVPFEVPNG